MDLNAGDKHVIDTKCEKIHPSDLRRFGVRLSGMQSLIMNFINFVPKHF